MRVVCMPGYLSGSLEAIPSKSHAHRILICAALADMPTRVEMNTRLSEDVEATVRCLRALGASFEDTGDALIVTPITVPPAFPLLDCAQSGSTLRFLLQVAAALGCGGVFTGNGRLPQRPIGPLVQAVRAAGVFVDRETLPLRIEGKLSSGTYTLPGNISSQFISGLLLALPILEKGGEIILSEALESAAYVEMTARTLAQFSVTIRKTDCGFEVASAEALQSPGTVAVEGDWSNMAFFLGAGALGGPVRCTGLSLDSVQGDRKILDLLARFGANVNADTAERGGLHSTVIDAREIPDLVPILAVIASVAQGTTKIENAARLRLKESDRLQTVANMLRALGGKVEEGEDFLFIEGQPSLRGGIVDCCGDHRIAMAGAIASTVCRERTILDGAETVAKSYPHFFEDFRMLGGNCDVVNDR